MEHRRHARNNGACDPGLYRTMYCTVMHHACTTHAPRSAPRTSASSAPTGLTSAAVGTMPKAPWKIAVEAAEPRLTCGSRGGIQRKGDAWVTEGRHSAEGWNPAER